MPTVEVEAAVVSRVKDQLANAQQALTTLVEGLPVPMTPAEAARGRAALPGTSGKVKTYTGTDSWWGRSSCGAREFPTDIVEAHLPYTGQGDRAVSAAPTQDELAQATGLPFFGGARPLRLTIWNPHAAYLKRSMEHNPDGTVIAKLYYSVDGWGGISSAFLAVRADGTYCTGTHG